VIAWYIWILSRLIALKSLIRLSVEERPSR
jgi:hypothetical protein